MANNDLQELDMLLERLCEDMLEEDAGKRLIELLDKSVVCRRRYLDTLELHAALWRSSGTDDGLGNRDQELEDIVGATVEPPGRIDLESRTSSPQFPAISPLPSPLPPSFVGGPVFSYMVASVVLCMMLLGAWAYKVTLVQPMSPGVAGPPSHRAAPERIVVGYITDMKDCRWNDEGTGTMVGASVPMGRNYALSAGLLEITYADGARVILEGPCDYTADSRTGGRLQLGKLVARVEKKVASGQWPVASAKPQAANPQPPAPSPSTLHPPLFTVSTPTAVVTDLGTEFGVEVGANGDTTSHVFRGSVRVQVLGENGLPDEGAGKELVLRADESARVKKVNRVRETHQGQPATEVVRLTHPAALPTFVRRMRAPPKQLDLLDIVAGGDGTGNRRERGIDPATGKQDTWFVDGQRVDDHAYHPVAWHPFIDGVFIPYVPTSLPPQPQDLRLDSAGNTFDRFLEGRSTEKHSNLHCTLHGDTIGGVWARAADGKSSAARRGWIFSLNNDEQYMPEGRGLLGLHANVGVTFDLAAVRQKHEGAYPVRLLGTAGMGEGSRKYADDFGIADLWIFVDGKLKWVRKDITAKDGPISVDVSLEPKDHFLTIVSTNGQRGKSYDWMVIGDPVLEMISNNSNGSDGKTLSDKQQPRKEERLEE